MDVSVFLCVPEGHLFTLDVGVELLKQDLQLFVVVLMCVSAEEAPGLLPPRPLPHRAADPASVLKTEPRDSLFRYCCPGDTTLSTALYASSTAGDPDTEPNKPQLATSLGLPEAAGIKPPGYDAQPQNQPITVKPSAVGPVVPFPLGAVCSLTYAVEDSSDGSPGKLLVASVGEKAPDVRSDLVLPVQKLKATTTHELNYKRPEHRRQRCSRALGPTL
ncbi:hypothetical protein EYF80_042388 [Liparis tanakae]|uniref:Uncharacterized protein n=1 Tax=Liparis tanakae TaxID=230148 RepID=A0A4Z2G2S8_9TELE|nr:hypothetical protein EYF80_042388 [Liparis tanakae]